MSEVRNRLRSDRLFVIKLAFLLAGALSFLFSVYLWFFVDQLQGVFVGIWVPSMWSLGALVLSTERGGT
ncbi:MAG: hypothetical protein R6X29_05715 [Acidimicrobiia bacterium]